MNQPVERMRPVHPGEVLREDFLVPIGLSVNALSVALLTPRRAFTKLSKSDTVCPPTPPLAWPVTLVAMPPHGWFFKRTLT